MIVRLLLLSTLGIVALGVQAQIAPVVASTASPIEAVPLQVGSWRGSQATPFTSQVIAALGVSAYLNRSYTAEDGRRANVYLGYYVSQQQGASVHSPLNCMPGAGWEPVWVERVPFAGGTARRVLIRKGPRRLMVHYWYQTVARVEGDEYRGRFYTALDTLRYHRNDAAIVRVIVGVGEGPDAEARAIRNATELATLLAPHVGRVLFPDAASLRGNR